ncbi:hypothetical protein ACFYNW_01375 [Streptomyces virginiae]|uniref:hypothetical protein n=1 Tax=Streptomyces virginiae TaxID=1961 RepID=UPI0036EE119F
MVPDAALSPDEARLQLKHPHMIVVHSVVEDCERPCIVTSPDESFRIGLKVSDTEPGGPLAVHRRSHSQGATTNPGYRDAEVVTSTRNGHAAAVRLFTWNGFSTAEGPRHTRDLCWEEGGRLYDAWVCAPVGRTAEARAHFDTAVATVTRNGG